MIAGKLKILLLSAVLFFSFGGIVFSESAVDGIDNEKTVIYFFDDRLCHVCRDAKEFIQSIKEDNPQIELNIYPISDLQKLSEVAEMYSVENYRVMSPTIFIEGKLFQLNHFTPREMEMIVSAIEGSFIEDSGSIINIPFLNKEIDIGSLSLPFIAVVLGSLDGFNICSIGALILILSIVLAFNSKKKIFFFGGLFILTTAVVYGLLVFAWGKLFEALIGHLEILRIVVGLAAFGGGVYFLKEFWRFFKYGPTCQSSESKIAQKATEKLQKAFSSSKRGWFFLVSAVVSFAMVITVVELPCSIGVPIAFSGMIVEAGVSLFEHILYVLIYLFFYMLIEIIIFTGAVFTKTIWIANSKAITWITLFGAAVLFYLSFYYLLS